MDKLSVVWLIFGVFYISVGAKNLQINPKNISYIECISTVQNQWELQPHPTICGWYVQCMNTIGIEQQCPGDLLFNPARGKCDNPEHVNCDDFTTATTPEDSSTDTTISDDFTSETTIESDTTVDTTIENDTTKVEEDTTVETTAEADNTATTNPTPDPETTTALTDTTLEDDTTEGSTEPDCEPLCADFQGSAGVVADPEYCDRFISCTDHCNGSTMFCPSGLHFNPIMSVCDLPERAECLLEICVDQPKGVIPSVNGCQHYYACIDSNATLQKCGPELVFDPVSEKCELENEGNACAALPDIPPPPSEVYSQCSPAVAEQLLRHPSYCNVFYVCVRGMLSGRICPEGLLFDELRGNCNLAEFVDCIDETEQQ